MSNKRINGIYADGAQAEDSAIRNFRIVRTKGMH